MALMSIPPNRGAGVPDFARVMCRLTRAPYAHHCMSETEADHIHFLLLTLSLAS